ncbi:MAG: ABC transporter ATP-binding protein [Cellulosilyticaceae bacterium]
MKCDTGRITLGGEAITHMPAEQREIGMVFQNYALFPHMNVYENVAYGLQIKKLPKQEIARRVAKYLKLVRLEGYDHRKVNELSGGEQQRVALARALAIEPKVLLLDEPLCNLDAKLRDEMREEIKSLQKQLGITTIFVTHDQKEALMLSDQIAVFEQGRCVQVGSPAAIYHQPCNAFVATFVGDANVLDQASLRQVLGDAVRLDEDQVVIIRPEQVQLSSQPIEGIDARCGRICSIQFNGQITQYHIEVGGVILQSVGLSTLAGQQPYEVGQTVWVDIPLHGISIVGV